MKEAEETHKTEPQQENQEERGKKEESDAAMRLA